MRADAERLVDAAFEELAGAVPRWISRTRRQVRVGRSLLSHLPGLAGLAPPARPAATATHERVAVTVVDVLSDDWEDSTTTSDVGGADVEREPHASSTAPVASMPSSEPVPLADELPLVDYDALAASQVVPRLASLSADELDVVRRYERGHRNRQTILGRVSQLLSDDG